MILYYVITIIYVMYTISYLAILEIVNKVVIASINKEGLGIIGKPGQEYMKMFSIIIFVIFIILKIILKKKYKIKKINFVIDLTFFIIFSILLFLECSIRFF